ncbi:MAG: MFS transporter [Acidobacteria bacterium]|nr:MAG: MFS transporter [Acidobacteriota bacterium]REK06350.1 MAG: MFS transporter [Acidobacteriota bacterium]
MATASAPLRETFRSLRVRDFRLFAAGMIGSLVGLWLQITALAWWMYELTGSAAWVGSLFLATQAPTLFLGPIAGAYADRLPKRSLLVAAQSLSLVPAVLLGALAITGRGNAQWLFGAALLAGLARAFEVPTRQSFVPQLVARDELSNAIALNSMVFNVARVVGPALAGVLIQTVGQAWCFFANAVACAWVVSTLARIRERGDPSPDRERRTLFADVHEGALYVRRAPLFLALFGCLLSLSIFGMPYGTLLPSFAERVLERGPGAYSAMQVAVALGALCGAFVLARRTGVASGLERWVLWGGSGFGVGLALLSRAPDLWTTLALLAFLGFTFMIHLSSSNVIAQTAAPDGLRGRVMSLHTTLFLGVYPFAGLVAGATSDRIGERPVMLACGVSVLVGLQLFGRRLVAAASDSQPDG